MSAMERNPVDDIIDKIVAELLKLNQFDFISQMTLNCISEILKSCNNLREVISGRYTGHWALRLRRGEYGYEAYGIPPEHRAGNSIRLSNLFIA